jgi:nucleotide-binding universal stress UspA family protein
MFTKILAAIDGLEYSDKALPAAIEIGKKFDSEVRVIHVVEHDRGRSAAYALETPAEATRMVADAVKVVKDAGLVAKGELVDRAAGRVAEAIAEYALENGIDLIVMGSRGLSDAQGFLRGSVTHRVMQLVEMPILIARPVHVQKEELEPAVR